MGKNSVVGNRTGHDLESHMRTDDGESVGYEFPIEIRRFVEDPVPVLRFHCSGHITGDDNTCLLYTSPSPRDGLLSRMPSSA